MVIMWFATSLLRNSKIAKTHTQVPILRYTTEKFEFDYTIKQLYLAKKQYKVDEHNKFFLLSLCRGMYFADTFI